MAGSGGTMDIVILAVLAGGFIFLWPQISGMLTPSAVVGATDTAGDAEASDKGGSVTAGQGGGSGLGGRADADAIRRRTKRMIAEITARARRGTRQHNSSGSGSNISCVNGHCTSNYGEMRMGISNVI